MDVLPACGGKIQSIRSLDTGREWLWHNPHLPLRQPVYGESYIEGIDFGGWDEIFPSVDPCVLELAHGEIVSVPDHGDLVSLPWKVEECSEYNLRLSVEGRCFPFRFTRTLSVAESGIDLFYELTSEGQVPMPWLWCAHPLFRLEPGMEVCWQGRDGQDIEGVTIPDPSAPDFLPLAEKIFTESGVATSVEIRPSGGEVLRLDFDPEENPFLGLWVNFSAWSGCGSESYFNLGIEPSTAPCDALPEARYAKLHRSLNPGERRHWTLRLSCPGSSQEGDDAHV